MLIRSGALDLIVIDSVAALVPRAEIEGEMGDSHVGLQARLMSQALRKMTGALNNSGTTAIFINQLREKIGVMFGSPETTTGGRALKFYSSVRLDVRRIETLKDGTEMVGNRTRVKVVKNKVAPPFKQAEFDIMYGQGISREGGLIDVGVEAGLVRKAGAWYTYEGDQLGQGKENARTFLRDNPDLANEIEKKILEKLGVGPTVDAPADGRRRSASMTSDPDGSTCRPGDGVDRLDRARRRRDAGRASPGPTPDRLGPGRRPGVGGPQDPARPADRPGPQPHGAGRQAAPSATCPTTSPTRLLDRFEEVGLVDDAAFARAWVAQRQPGKGLARRALAQELRRKGVDDEVAREALDEIDPDDEEEAARALVRASCARCAALDRHGRDPPAGRACSPARATRSGLAFPVVREELAEAGRGSRRRRV